MDRRVSESFQQDQGYLSNPPVLVPLEHEKPVLLYLSNLDNAFGCMLGQHDETERKEQAVYYLSKKFTPCEAKYTLIERTCCALAWITQMMRHYIEFVIVHLTHKAIKGQALDDRVAENPVDKDYELLTTYFPDEEVLFTGEDIAESYPGGRMFFDGASNFKGVGIGLVLISESGQHYPASTNIRFPCTNYMAEYEACFLGIRMSVDMNIKELLVIGDSDLLIHQVRGEWTTKNVKILSYLHYVKELCKKFTKIEFKHIPRILSEFADALETLSSMIQHPDTNYIDPIEIEVRDQHAYYFHVDEEPDGKPWYCDIKKFP
ncbi:uncharacterized protein [Nicotiana tomentosiformis]|uniref:uncharacterized protein n=1 Tax=Nicotiana tomentosiformis TaxID=4098 RepID=UPI00388C51F2